MALPVQVTTTPGKRRLALTGILIILAGLAAQFLLASYPVRALELTNRSVKVSSQIPSAVTNHAFQFTYASTGTVGSLVFEYCDNSPLFNLACNAPAGLNLTASTLSYQNGNSGFGIDNVNTTANKLVLTRIPIASVAVPSFYTISNVTNPSAAATAIYIRISTYATANASGPYTDNGAVAFATSSPFNVNAYVPPYLRFCVAISVAPDCSTMSGDSVNLGILSPALATSAQSQFSTGTNDPSGYVVYVTGTTMTSGNNVITALASPSPSLPGTAQFGINLRANTVPAVGQEPFGAGTGSPSSNYSFPNFFMFSNGDAIAASPLPSDFNKMTVSYLVNVSAGQAPGVYSATFSYVATVQF